VISSDHGELLGDPDTLILYHKFAHNCKFAPGNRLVPWLVVNRGSGERKKITPGGTTHTEDVSETVVAKQLEALGYGGVE